MTTIKETHRYRTLSKVINSSFGNSSEAKYLTHYVKFNVIGEGQLQILIAISGSLANRDREIELKRKWRQDCEELAGKYLKKIKGLYEEEVERENASPVTTPQTYEKPAPKTITLTVNEATITEGLEITTYSIYNPNKHCIYRWTAVAEF